MLNRLLGTVLMAVVLIMAVPAFARAEEAAGAAAGAAVDTGDMAFILISAALVMLMTPGLALFYGGMSRTKHVLSTIMYSLIALGAVSVQWVMFGYSLSFGPDVGCLLGSLDWVGLRGVGLKPSDSYATTVPHQAFMVFQMMFAVITAALISGAVAERMRFSAFLAFNLFWTTFIYDPVAHWVWGGGWLAQIGALDFAGGTVVHILSGVSGLVACIVIGKRKGYGTEPMIPHNLPMTVAGAALLWFGWFGFNAGSALMADGIAVSAFVVTHVATASALVSWITVEWIRHGKPTVLGAASGAVAGLVAITPASGFVDPIAAIIIGLVAGAVCCLAVSSLKRKLGYDDSLDAFGVHGIGGTWGALATGIFANPAVNELRAGLLYGNANQVVIQLISIVASWAVAALGTLAILKLIGLAISLRASDEEEEAGLDISQHGEYAYTGLASGTPSSAGGLPAAQASTVVKPAL